MYNIEFKADKEGEKYIPFWKTLTTAGRAAEGLRDDWRKHLKELQDEIGFKYIRFHGIFCDEMMIYHEDSEGNAYYNFQYLDSLFDFLLEVNLKPFIELGFMPSILASGEGTIFWWKGNTTPPKDYNKWAELVKKTIIHCINRYGITEVLTWYFEVWNEPDLHNEFWYGTMEEYFMLYEFTVKTIKSIDSKLKVGGPSTTKANEKDIRWIDEFIEYCNKKNLPIDFISGHPYPNNWPLDTNGKFIMAYRDENSTQELLTKLKEKLKPLIDKGIEIHLSEWNSSPSPRDLVHDTCFMAPFIIQNNIRCIGITDSLGFWTFTDVFEETMAGDTVFHGGFGLKNFQGINKPSYYGYWFLSKLGDEMISQGDEYFVTKKNNDIQILMWNFTFYKDNFADGFRHELSESDRYSIFKSKEDNTFNVHVDNLQGNYKIKEYIFDRENGSAFDEWIKNGAFKNPTKEEIEILKNKSRPSVKMYQNDNIFKFTNTYCIRPHGVVFIEIQKQI